MRWGTYPGLSRRAYESFPGCGKNERKKKRIRRNKDEKKEIRSLRGIPSTQQGCQKSKDADGLQKLEKTRKQILLQNFQKKCNPANKHQETCETKLYNRNVVC